MARARNFFTIIIKNFLSAIKVSILSDNFAFSLKTFHFKIGKSSNVIYRQFYKYKYEYILSNLVTYCDNHAINLPHFQFKVVLKTVIGTCSKMSF